MDKKSGRSVQPLAKGACFEKKVQDGRSWPKGSQRREPSSGSFSSKPDNRKNVNRIRIPDKRPKPRGQQDAVARNEASSLENQSHELGSVYLQGKKNISHLTNFKFAPRDGMQRENGNKSFKTNNSVKRHKYMKEDFLQANCQFVVNTSGDYKQLMSNPDAIVDWNYIEQINILVNDFPLCPICRYPPSAAKITRCGHIYCWSCFLHYLDISQHSYQECPICFQSVYKGDLKSVTIIPRKTFNIGETITFKLMKRNENSLTPYPAEQTVLKENSSIVKFSDDELSKMYCKLLLAENSDIYSIIDRENRELKEQLAGAEESEECFIQKAILFNEERESKVTTDRLKEMGIGETPPSRSLKDMGRYMENSENRPNSKYIYFYQASDGQHIYIHSFNVRMLKHSYGSLEFAPTTITATILSKESDYMSEEYRKCFKYLAHLPVACPFETMEIELDDKVVTQETLDYFQAELEERKKKRMKKAKEEKIREKRILEEENLKIYQRYPAANIPLESTEQFPLFKSPPLSVAEMCPLVEEDTPSNSGSRNWEHSGPSFAKMAASMKTPTNPWPNLSSSAIDIPQRKSKMTPLSVLSGRRRYNSSDTENCDQEPNFEPRATMGDAIAQALQKVSQPSQSGSSSSSEKGKKKKKPKPRVLLSNASSSYS